MAEISGFNVPPAVYKLATQIAERWGLEVWEGDRGYFSTTHIVFFRLQGVSLRVQFEHSMPWSVNVNPGECFTHPDGDGVKEILTKLSRIARELEGSDLWYSREKRLAMVEEAWKNG